MESTMQAVKEKINKKCKISEQNHIIEEIGENGEIQYSCTACRKNFRSRSQRYYHIKCNVQNLVFECEYCDKSFARQTQWKYHTESHISPVNECHKCGKIFSNPLGLKKHLSLHNVEPKLCPHCHKTFKSKISLDQHIAAQHLNQLQYGCAHCSKKYASKSSLHLHLQTHEKKRFECTFCGKLFQRNSILNLHLKRHYKTNRYICTVCQKVFCESGALARHRKIHQESVLQYYCKLCDKSILRKDNMTRHFVTLHPEEKFEEIVETIKSPRPIPSQQTAVENEVCDLYNTMQDNITKSDKSCLIIENILLHEPLEVKQSTKDNLKSFVNKDNTVQYPLTNQIKVITAVPNYKKEIFTDKNENTSQEFTKQYQNSNNHQHEQKDSIFENQGASYKNTIRVATNSDFNFGHNRVIEQSVVNEQNISFLNPVHSDLNKTPNHRKEQIIEQESANSLKYFHTDKNESTILDTALVYQQQKVQNGPRTTQMYSSVIRSVGNVTKNLTSNIVTSTKPINQMSLEYKHKKYSRNNYNIDLYRKILGCDEDDDENVEKQEKCDHMLKSPTPVHWRKCFKNNYETTGS